MISKRVADWIAFSDRMREHIEATEKGHYHGDIQPLDFFERWFSLDSLCWQVCKYMTRWPQTGTEADLLKAAHYLSRLWSLQK
jgi:hypothetical protein